MRRKSNIVYKAWYTRTRFNKFSNSKHIRKTLKVQEEVIPEQPEHESEEDRQFWIRVKWSFIEIVLLLIILFVVIKIQNS